LGSQLTLNQRVEESFFMSHFDESGTVDRWFNARSTPASQTPPIRGVDPTQ